MQLLNAFSSGDELTARARVTGNYEKKGHRFVELDALVVANGRTPVAHCQHIAIYQPREQAGGVGLTAFWRHRASQLVIAGRSRPKDGVASARLCPAIHPLRKTLMKFDGYAGQARV
jgi:hypothetical protein